MNRIPIILPSFSAVAPGVEADGTSSVEYRLVWNSEGHALELTGSNSGVIQSLVLEGVATTSNIAEEVESAMSGIMDTIDKKADKDYVDNLVSSSLSSVYTLKGKKDSFDDLPSDAAIGDVWQVNEEHTIGEGDDAVVYPAGTDYRYTEEGWVPVVNSIDLSDYVKRSELNEIVGEKLSELFP